MNYLNSDGLQHLWSKIVTALSGKQDTLTAGDNITIEDGVISSTGGVGVEEVYIGSTEPTADSDAVLWFNPDGEPVENVFATIEYVDNAVAGVEVDLSDYALKTEIPTVPTNVSAFTNDAKYATEEYVTQAVADVEVDLTGYATETYVQEQIAAIPDPDLSNYALKSEIPTVPTNVSAFTNDAGYATETYVQEQIASVDVEVPNASSTVVGGITARLSGTTLYLRNDGGTA